MAIELHPARPRNYGRTAWFRFFALLGFMVAWLATRVSPARAGAPVIERPEQEGNQGEGSESDNVETHHDIAGSRGYRLRVPAGTVAAIIPAHNEQAVIGATLRSILVTYRPEDVYVFCDGCTDATATIARSLLPDANVVDHRENIGKSRGIENLLRLHIFPKNYVYVSIIDADSTIEPEFLANSLRVLRRSDVIAVTGQVKARWYPKNLYSVYRTYIYWIVFTILKRLQSFVNAVSIASGCATTWKTAALAQITLDHALSTEDIDMTIQVHRKRLGRIKYVPSAVVWTQDPFNMASFRRQNYRWNRAWWEGVRKNRLGARWIQLHGRSMPTLSMVDVFTLLVMIDIFVIGAGGMILMPLGLIHPVDLTLPWLSLDGTVTLNSRPLILAMLAWEYGWIIASAVFVSIVTRRPRVALYSPLYIPLMYVEMLLYVQCLVSTCRSLYRRGTEVQGSGSASAWISPDRKIEEAL
jgi:poly-beta-1,6-N-acetyl-D-glucosamine synthase